MFNFLFGWRKASDCKKLIRRVQCRLKPLKNKRCSIVRQLRDDVGQLLKHGHEQSAFDRVEQIFKDESIVAVYDLLDHFCEFIIIHLSYIRKHKDCPNDINEAVSTLIFASARCGDLHELPVIRKLFGERYGQKFALVALELLPGNLVNRQIKENLSIKSVPDDVKYKLVDEIARSFLEPGPLALEYYSELQIEPCHSQQGSDGTGGRMNGDSVNRKDEWRVGNYAHLKSPYKSKIPSLLVDNEVGMAMESSSDSLSQLPKEMIFLDDVEEFESSMSKDGNSQDQRLFLFRSSVSLTTDKGEDGFDESSIKKSEFWNEMSGSKSSKKSRKASGKRQRMRSVSKEGINVKDVESTIYYGGSFDNLRYDNLRRKHHKRIPFDEIQNSFAARARLDQPCCFNTGKNRTVHDCSLKDPCYFCTSDDKDDSVRNLKEEKVKHNICCSNCQCFWNRKSNIGEVKWVLVLHKSSEDYRIGVMVPNETIKNVEKPDGFPHSPYLRAMTMPVETSSDCRVDNMLRSNSFPCQQATHVHPKLPDYDQLAAKFKAIKKANFECKSDQLFLAA